VGKGDWRRPTQVSREEADANWEAIFGTKKLNNMSDEDREKLHEETNEPLTDSSTREGD
jgi:hypothetical protein